MKSVLISIQPKWCEKIANGEKTIEVRKTRPKIETPFKCYIYCTKGENLWLTQKGVKSKTELTGYLMNGKVIGEFVCDWITKITPNCDIKGSANQYIHGYPAILGENDCLSFQEMKAYLGNKNGYSWHISNLKIFDKPKDLNEFTPRCKFKNDLCRACCFYEEAFGGCCKVFTRPSESWCYVEELEEE